MGREGCETRGMSKGGKPAVSNDAWLDKTAFLISLPRFLDESSGKQNGEQEHSEEVMGSKMAKRVGKDGQQLIYDV